MVDDHEDEPPHFEEEPVDDDDEPPYYEDEPVDYDGEPPYYEDDHKIGYEDIADDFVNVGDEDRQAASPRDEGSCIHHRMLCIDPVLTYLCM